MSPKEAALLALIDYVTAPTQTQRVQARERARQAGAELRKKIDGAEAEVAIEATNARLDRWRQNASLQPVDSASGALWPGAHRMQQWFSGCGEARGAIDDPLNALEADDTRITDRESGV